MSTKLLKPITITIEDQETLNLFAALTGSVGINILHEFGVDPAKAYTLFSELDHMACKDNPVLLLIKKDKL